ncbi:pyridoxamine 5'-phosphate oxidase family protein [Amycolatopsis sp. cmx-4-68]|uniref:pyridoxamine 5'-phosphate oxidase family protein n=1 Tax=Amycolatopsis sp. cmx-4-68 TaxID=2790938 RepID=UPI00397AE7DA
MPGDATPFTPEVVEILSTPANAMIITLVPDGAPTATAASVGVAGDELAVLAAAGTRAAENLRADPRITVLVVDPADATHVLEVRGVATLGERSPKVRIEPAEVNWVTPGRDRVDPGPAPTIEKLDGTVVEEDEKYWIEFARPVDHDPEAVWAALTEPRRLAIWEHPVTFFPGLRVGATIYAQLNIEANAVALGKVTELDPPRVFGFRWTTNNPLLPPEFGIRFEFGDDRILRVRSGPFSAEHGVVPLTASMHIHLDHFEAAVTAPEAELPSEPWPEKSVVTRSGRMADMARSYGAKLSKEHPGLRVLLRQDHMRT